MDSRYLLGFGSIVLAAAGLFWWQGLARVEQPFASPPSAEDGSLLLARTPPGDPPAAPARSREARRFERYDKDRDGIISRDEYLVSRRKAFTKLDKDGDGRLGFDEWVAKTSDRFAGADMDRSQSLTRDEFATTKPKRKPRVACSDVPPNDD